MQIVIEIQDDVLERMRNGEHRIYDLVGAVMEGIVLPEHHGRLIDAKVACPNHTECVICPIAEECPVCAAPTIIPATKEGDGE